jgi:ATP-binding cassette subfamily B (MDR/TAP) protein 1
VALPRRPAIQSDSPDGQRPSACQGDIEVKDIVFKYPSRPNQIILNGYDLKVYIPRLSTPQRN